MLHKGVAVISVTVSYSYFISVSLFSKEQARKSVGSWYWIKMIYGRSLSPPKMKLTLHAMTSSLCTMYSNCHPSNYMNNSIPKLEIKQSFIYLKRRDIYGSKTNSHDISICPYFHSFVWHQICQFVTNMFLVIVGGHKQKHSFILKNHCLFSKLRTEGIEWLFLERNYHIENATTL